MTDADPKFQGMTVNERLSALGLFELFDEAVRSRNQSDVVQILRQAKLTEEQAEETARTVLSDPKRYGY